MKTTSPIRRISKIAVLLISIGAIFLGMYSGKCRIEKSASEEIAVKTEVVVNTAEVQEEPQETEQPPVFSSEAIPEEIQGKMINVTISEKSRVKFDDLSYLTLSYVGYDSNTHTGNMIVDKNLAEEVIKIFEELYEIRFPIEKIRLPYEYDGVDELSMRDNNTSAFNDRPIAEGGGLSYHQLGRAIDINPLVNPYIKFSTGVILPETGTKYLDRNLDEIGMIKENSACVTIFKKYGWTWGGDWKSLKDYQHFEKR